jgi:hypothetical protein
MVVSRNGDTRLKNTTEELSNYDSEMNQLLDRVFDEYGLITCGWSATWDKALRAAIFRCANRRYSTFWTAKGAVSEEADELIKFRRASELSIESADKFFLSLENKLEALERLNAPHPLSASLAVASLKRFLVEDRFRIQLNDLVSGEVERQVSEFSKLGVSVNRLECDALHQRLLVYESGMQILLPLVANGCYWGTVDQAPLWSRVIIRLLDPALPAGGTTILVNLRRYPALMALYAAGIACIAHQQFGILKVLLRDSRTSVDFPLFGKDDLLIRKLHMYDVLPVDALNSCSSQKLRTPGSDRLHNNLREIFRLLIPSDKDYDDLFDRWEYLLSLVGCDASRDIAEYFAPAVGRFGWRHRGFGRDEASIVNILSKEHEKLGGNWEAITSGLFENSERFLAAEKDFKEKVLARFSPY